MQIRATPKEMGLVFRRLANTLEPAVRAAERESGEEALKVAQELSSGPYTSAMLKALGHPYATRAPNPPQDAGVINRQLGEFYNSWRLRAPRRVGTVMRTRLVNVSYHAAFLEKGTRLMIARPIKEAIATRMENTRRKIMRRHLKTWARG
mgnify:CR=1 FL=1